MSDEVLTQAIFQGAEAALFLAGPILAVSLLVALFLGILQAAMQLQEQTIPQIVKIGVITVMLLASGASLASPLVDFTRRVMTDFRFMVR